MDEWVWDGDRPMKSRFEGLQDGLLGSVRDGLSLDDAATRAGVSVHTVRGWVREGRKHPEGRFGVFATALSAAQSEPQNLDPNQSGSMAWAEFEGHLAASIRAGSVTAMKLFADLHRAQVPEQPAESGSLGRLDELAAARQRRTA